MFISGLQKLTLLDYPGKVACTLFTAGCNFRCPFCHNAPLVISGVPETQYSEEEILAFLKKRIGILEGVAVTGGEPLLHKELPEFLEKVKALGYSVKLDTNGSFPDRLKAVVNAGLADRVAMDIKDSPAGYARAAGLKDFDLAPIRESIEFLMNSGTEYEFRTTVVKGIHTRESLLEAAGMIAGAKEYYLQQYKNSGQLIAPEGLDEYSPDEMRAFAEAVRPLVPSAAVRGV